MSLLSTQASARHGSGRSRRRKKCLLAIENYRRGWLALSFKKSMVAVRYAWLQNQLGRPIILTSVMNDFPIQEDLPVEQTAQAPESLRLAKIRRQQGDIFRQSTHNERRHE